MKRLADTGKTDSVPTGGPSMPPAATPKRADSGFLVPIFTRRQKVLFWSLSLVWMALAANFWVWWLRPEHNLGTVRYVAVTLVIFWIFFLQLYFVLIFLRARKASGRLEDLGPARVAMVVTKTPSEPFSVVRQTLEGMLAQDYPHDTWLADEDPAPETVAWCEAHGVRISTRKGRPDYHRKEWPRRTRCKEGNLAFFYDHYGYENYDFVVQMDADHTPRPGYLRAMLRPFLDPRVGYVSAPSICASNAAESWAARMRLHAEAMFHGVLQAGYTNGWAPMCIGSHYGVRTRALREIGGLGPELAEDHSTSMMFNAHGWRGVHAIDAIAIGAGPATIADLATQEFQWSRSLLTLLLRYTPRYFRGLRPVLKFQFVFSQLWYPLFAIFMAVMYAMPVAAILFDIRFADVTYPAFLGHSIPPMIALVVLATAVRNAGFFRPADAPVISWEKALFPSAQWPWVLWGCIMAVRDRLVGGFVDFRITPKGEAADANLPYRVIFPYVLLAAGALATIVLRSGVQEARGFYILALLNAAMYTSLVFIIVGSHLRASREFLWRRPLLAMAEVGSVLLLCTLIGTGLVVRSAESIDALTAGADWARITRARFTALGAGTDPAHGIRYEFTFGDE